jgi:hypothetical protein
MQMNMSATSNRVYTCAETIAQNQIDGFLSAQPYSPQLSQIPTELVTGTTTSTVPIYTDPASGGTLSVSGTMTRVVEDLALTQLTNGKTDNLDARRINVTIDYTFKGRAYQVSLSSVRTSDF